MRVLQQGGEGINPLSNYAIQRQEMAKHAAEDEDDDYVDTTGADNLDPASVVGSITALAGICLSVQASTRRRRSLSLQTFSRKVDSSLEGKVTAVVVGFNLVHAAEARRTRT